MRLIIQAGVQGIHGVEKAQAGFLIKIRSGPCSFSLREKLKEVDKPIPYYYYKFSKG